MGLAAAHAALHARLKRHIESARVTDGSLPHAYHAVNIFVMFTSARMREPLNADDVSAMIVRWCRVAMKHEVMGAAAHAASNARHRHGASHGRHAAMAYMRRRYIVLAAHAPAARAYAMPSLLRHRPADNSASPWRGNAIMFSAILSGVCSQRGQSPLSDTESPPRHAASDMARYHLHIMPRSP